MRSSALAKEPGKVVRSGAFLLAASVVISASLDTLEHGLALLVYSNREYGLGLCSVNRVPVPIPAIGGASG